MGTALSSWDVSTVRSWQGCFHPPSLRGWSPQDRLFLPLLCIPLRNAGCPLPGGSHSPAQGAEASLIVWEEKWEWISQKRLIRKLPEQAGGEWLHSRGVSSLLCHWGVLGSTSRPVPDSLVFSCLCPSTWPRGCAWRLFPDFCPAGEAGRELAVVGISFRLKGWADRLQALSK